MPFPGSFEMHTRGNGGIIVKLKEGSGSLTKKILTRSSESRQCWAPNVLKATSVARILRIANNIKTPKFGEHENITKIEKIHSHKS